MNRSTTKSAAGKGTTGKLTAGERALLLSALEARFNKHPERHADITWTEVLSRLETNAGALWSLHEMERTEGEPDVVGRDGKTGEFLFIDCSAQTPKGRVSVCYDRDALNERKEHKPDTSAMDLAEAMGIEMLTEDQYLALQKLGEFDTTTSSWLMTPDDIRRLGGALFGDRRYGRVFIYQNGASSYYRVRGFRGCLRV